MSILVVGSIALDTVATPHGQVDDAPGGSALYFSAAASTFTPVNVVGVIGDDFDFAPIEFLKKRKVDLQGLQQESGKTFRWGGKYHQNMNRRDTLFTELNVFENFQPVIPEHYRNSRLVFLANIAPELQLDVLNQVESPALTVLDTMNFWISSAKETLMDVIRRIDILIINDEEIEQLTGESNIFKAAGQIIQEGPRAIVVKKGEHGSVLIGKESCFLAPAFPVAKVVDPTGAGDSFAGGFLGYLATRKEFDDESLRMALITGSVIASYTVEDFSLNSLQNLTIERVRNRINRLREMTRF